MTVVKYLDENGLATVWNKVKGIIPDAVEANPTVPSGASANSLSGLKIGSSYYDIATALSELSDDSTHRVVTDTEKDTWDGKQDRLVSGDNIKTINNESLLGGGNITINADTSDCVKITSQSFTNSQKSQARANIGAASVDDLANVNSEEYVVVSVLPTASSTTLGKIYLVGPDGNSEYARYITTYNGISYSWIQFGTTAIPSPTIANNLTTDDPTKALSAAQGVVLEEEISQLGQEIDELGRYDGLVNVTQNGFYVVDEQLNIGFQVDSNGAKGIGIVNYTIE